MKQQFNSIAFVLFSIFFLCLIFAGMKWGLINPVPGTGLALIYFGAIPHLLALIYCIYKSDNTPAAILIGMFFGFWAFIGTTLLFSVKGLTQNLLWIELGMVALIATIAIGFYKKAKKPQSILLYGLIPLIIMLWAEKLGIATIATIATWAARICLPIVGIWALWLMQFQLKPPSEKLKDAKL